MIRHKFLFRTIYSSTEQLSSTKLVVGQENDIAKGGFRRFTWELRIGEDRAGNRQGLGKSTEPRKTKI
jgi:hypothetical protein